MSDSERVRHLLDLPPELVVAIAGQLSVRDAQYFVSTCTALRAHASSSGSLWRDLLGRFCGLALSDSGRALAVLRKVHSQPATRLRFVGIFTDGGIDTPYHGGEVDDDKLPEALSERDLQYWVDSLFQPAPWLLYCSASGRANVVCGGQLVGVHDPDVEAHESTRREYMLQRLEVIARDEWQMPVHGFGGLASASPEVLDEAFYAATEINMVLLLHGITGTIERGHHLLKIRRIRSQIEHRWQARRQMRQSRLRAVRANGRTFLFDPAPTPAPRTSQTIGIVERLHIRRPTSCSCPVSHGVIFGATRPVSAEDMLAGCAPAVDSASDELVAGGDFMGDERFLEGIGRIVHTTRTEEGWVHEVEAPSSRAAENVFPIAAFAFDDGRTLAEGLNTESGEQVIELRLRRAVRFLIVKLLKAEDRMRACNDDHDDMNVDMDYVGVDGHIVDDELVRVA